MSEPTVNADTTAVKTPWKVVVVPAAAGALIASTALMVFFSLRAPATPVAAKPPVATPQRQVQIVTMFDCQFMTINDPFTILHLPTCTNTHHYKQ